MVEADQAEFPLPEQQQEGKKKLLLAERHTMLQQKEKKLQDYERSLDSRFKKYEVGEATVYKVGSNYAVYDLKRIPSNGNVSNTLTQTATTLKQAKSIAENLSDLIKKDKKGTRVR